MAIKDRWADVRKNLGRLLLGHGGGYGADTFVKGIHDAGLPDAYLDAYVDAAAYAPGGRSHGDLMLYSAVAPFIQWKMRVYPDAMPGLRRKAGERFEVVPRSPFLERMAAPNAQQDFVSILQATIMEMDVDGNAYWLKERNNGGAVTGVYWVRRNSIRPDRELSEAMEEPYYLYTPGGTAAGSYPVPAVDVVHHRFGIDPRDHRLGISPLRAALRDVLTDELAQRHTAALLENFAAAGTLVSIDGSVKTEQLAVLEKRWHDKMGGRNRGRTMFVNKGLTATQMTTTPKDMELSLVRYLTEERVSALTGVPAIVAGVGAGLRRATYANIASAQRIAWLNTALPALREFASAMTRQLLVDFAHEPGTEVYFDTTNVAALQEDTEKRSARLGREYRDRLITRAEARADMGRDVKPGDDVYFSEERGERREA